jgi:hypothetical protein
VFAKRVSPQGLVEGNTADWKEIPLGRGVFAQEVAGVRGKVGRPFWAQSSQPWV